MSEPIYLYYTPFKDKLNPKIKRYEIKNMRIRNLDKNGDWCFGNSQIDYLREQNAIELDIKLRLNEWYRDCFFALQKGIAWSIRLGYKNQQQLLDRDIKNVVLGTTGVLNLTNFESVVLNRRYRATMTIYTQYSGDGRQFTYETEL